MQDEDKERQAVRMGQGCDGAINGYRKSHDVDPRLGVVRHHHH